MIQVTRRELLAGAIAVAGATALVGLTPARAKQIIHGLDRNKTYQVWHMTENGKHYVGKFNGVTSYYLPENCFLTEGHGSTNP